jgi:hypothetical protein
MRLSIVVGKEVDRASAVFAVAATRPPVHLNDVCSIPNVRSRVKRANVKISGP